MLLGKTVRSKIHKIMENPSKQRSVSRALWLGSGLLSAEGVLYIYSFCSGIKSLKFQTFKINDRKLINCVISLHSPATEGNNEYIIKQSDRHSRRYPEMPWSHSNQPNKRNEGCCFAHQPGTLSNSGETQDTELHEK